MDILLTTNNDIDLTDNQMQLTTQQQDLTRQKVYINLATYKGECFWDITAGIPYLKNDNNPEQLLGKTSDKRFLDAAIQEGILSRDGIVRLVSYSSDWNKNLRTLTVSAEAETEHGDIVSLNNIELQT